MKKLFPIVLITLVMIFVIGCGYSESQSYPPPSLNLLSPNGGEKWVAGKTYNISWESKGEIGKFIDIYLYKWRPSGDLFPVGYVALHVSAGDNVYQWKIPEKINPGFYKLRVRTHSKIKDISDEPFEILDRWAEDTRFLYVKVVADEEYREYYGYRGYYGYKNWQEWIADQIIAPFSKELYDQTGIKIKIVEFEEWNSESDGTPEALLEELRTDFEFEAEQNFDTIIGFTAASVLEGAPGGLCGIHHILVVDYENCEYQGRIFLHELGHLFGAIDLYDYTESIMSYLTWTKATCFDEHNLKIILQNKYTKFK